MKRDQPELSEKAWISRFWAQYSKLPETYKKGFVFLAQTLVKESGNNETGAIAIPPDILTKSSDWDQSP